MRKKYGFSLLLKDMPWNSLENSVEPQNLMCITKVKGQQKLFGDESRGYSKGIVHHCIIDILGVTTGHSILGKIQRMTILWFQRARFWMKVFRNNNHIISLVLYF